MTFLSVVVGFVLVGLLAGTLTAHSGYALSSGLVGITAILGGALVLQQPLLVGAAALGVIPGYVRGRRDVESRVRKGEVKVHAYVNDLRSLSRVKQDVAS